MSRRERRIETGWTEREGARKEEKAQVQGAIAQRASKQREGRSGPGPGSHIPADEAETVRPDDLDFRHSDSSPALGGYMSRRDGEKEKRVRNRKALGKLYLFEKSYG